MKPLLTIILCLVAIGAQSQAFTYSDQAWLGNIRPPVAGGGGGGATIGVQFIVTNTSDAFADPQTFNCVVPQNMVGGYIALFYGGWSTSAGEAVTSGTFNSVAMNFLGGITNVASGHGTMIYGLSVGSLSAGTYTMSVDMRTAGIEGSFCVVGLTNVNQSSSAGTASNQTGASGTLGTVTPASNTGEIVFAVAAGDDLSASPFNSSQTVVSLGLNSGGTADGIVSRKGGLTTSTPMYFTNAANAAFSFSGVAIKP